ncbi:protein-disulfide reductase DsbD domain-containing protein [Carboxylicivirga caseinilyticus]|uniref:protein-disulfide reductase DsbD domain-containing protein n=1 Tax=Carboxylicivirga caseinilyticus TaxID=3417572 RepID=UPI003D34B2C7|nr:hypothetical protein [Marinilabiliaceae bacterium A049]
MKKGLFMLFSLLVMGLLSVTAQMKEPVKWKIELKQVNQYEVQVVATATVDEGWKIYGLNVPEGGPVATTITFEEGEGYRPLKNAVEVQKATVKHDEVFDLDVPFFKEKAVFTQNVRVTKKPAKIKGYVTFMCCDNETCLPPTDVEFEFEVK